MAAIAKDQAEGRDVHIEQVKEKFGGLRFYVYGVSEEAMKFIEAAEAESYKVCEACGSRDNVKTESDRGWLVTRCGACRDKEAQ